MVATPSDEGLALDDALLDALRYAPTLSQHVPCEGHAIQEDERDGPDPCTRQLYLHDQRSDVVVQLNNPRRGLRT